MEEILRKVTKKILENQKCKIALTWIVHVNKTLQNYLGNILKEHVFGHNFNVLLVQTDKLPTLKTTTDMVKCT